MGNYLARQSSRFFKRDHANQTIAIQLDPLHGTGVLAAAGQCTGLFLHGR